MATKNFIKILLVVLAVALPGWSKCGVPTTKRRAAVRHQFMVATGYPHGRKGYVVDHILALCKGGPDTVANLQWQTVAEAKAKDKWECRCDVPPLVVKP